MCTTRSSTTIRVGSPARAAVSGPTRVAGPEVPGEGAQQLGQPGTDAALPRPPRTIQDTFPRLRRLQPEERAPRPHARPPSRGM